MVFEIKSNDPSVIIDVMTNFFSKIHGFIRKNCEFIDENKTIQKDIGIDFVDMKNQKPLILGNKIALYFFNNDIKKKFLSQKFLEYKLIKENNSWILSENEYIEIKRNRKVEKNKLNKTNLPPFIKYRKDNNYFTLFLDRKIQYTNSEKFFTSYGLCKNGSNLSKIFFFDNLDDK